MESRVMFIGTVEPPIPGNAVSIGEIESLERIGIQWKRTTEPAEIHLWFTSEPADWSEFTETLLDFLNKCPEDFDHIAIQWINMTGKPLDEPGAVKGSCEVIFRETRKVFHSHTEIPKLVKEYRTRKNDPKWFDTEWTVSDIKTLIEEKAGLEAYVNPESRWEKVWKFLSECNDEVLAELGRDIKKGFSDRTTELSWEVMETLLYDAAEARFNANE